MLQDALHVVEFGDVHDGAAPLQNAGVIVFETGPRVRREQQSLLRGQCGCSGFWHSCQRAAS
jgi:hypothetical protein